MAEIDPVLLLLARPSDGALDASVVERVAAALKALGAEAQDARWREPGAAWEATVSPAQPPDQIDRSVREAVADQAVDVVVLHGAALMPRRKSLLIADMDSTIVTSETLDELAEAAGIKAQVAGITARAMNGELDFHAAVRERVGLLAGLSTRALETTLARTALSPGARRLIQGMRAAGAHTLLVSGGFRYFIDAIVDQAGFHEGKGNRLEIDGDRLTGRIHEPIMDKDGKLATLRDALAERGLSAAQAMAIGDGANDLPMLKAAGLGVAYRAKPIVAAEVPVRLDHADLDALLHVQDIATPPA